ncbi:MAG: response regulator [Nocardioides sp.]|nr:response regulator [Nocardioides sp.]
MLSTRLDSARRHFELAALLAAFLMALFAILLLPVWPQEFRAAVTVVGLILAGLVGTISGVLRVRRTRGRDRRPWLVLSVASVIAVLGNVWGGLTGVDPVTSPSLVSDGSIALALVISTLGLLAFPGTRRRGAELLEMFLDGLVAGGALLIIVSVLVYSELLDSSARDGTAAQLAAVVIPVLDVVLATVALLLILRAPRSQRLLFVLVAIGFLLYAVADLTFAVRAARGTFEFGSLLDLGWIAGYLTFGLAAWVPADWHGRRDDEPGAGLSDSLGTMLVFAVLLVAAVVQIGFGDTPNPRGAQAVAWIVLVLAAGTRQVLLTGDNAALRRGLERRVAEQTADLRRLVRQNELLLDSVGDGIYGVDHEGRVTFLNPSAAVSLGFTLAELDGRRAHDVFHAAAQDGTRLPWEQCHVKRVMVDRGVSTSEGEVYARADGSSFPVEITAAPLLDDAGVLGAVVVFRDVTQRREVDRMKNEFLSVVSHELRTPLTSIRASLELIEDGRLGALPARVGSMITVALESTVRLTRLINDLLDIERIESGARPMQIATLDARRLLEAAAEQIEGMARSMQVRVEVGEVEGRVLADEDQIIQTLLNLLGNATKFSDPGTVVVLEARPDGDLVRFLVRDHGRGIPDDKLEAVFERFGQVDSSDTRQKGGTGLGLAISRGIVQRHGGEIWAESELGVGTTVSFTLPAARVVPLPGNQTDPRRTTVLVCDDDPHVVESFSAVLDAQGYRVVGVTDGAGVAELLLTEQPAVVLLDLLMPGTTGAQVLQALRADEATNTIPVVVVSGLGPEADPHVADATEGWLVKPVSEERLVHTVAAALAGRAGAGTVLLVEDDDALATVITAMLSAEGLDVVRAASATEAVVRGHELRPDVVVLDLLLPDGDGSDVVAEFRRRGTLASTSLIVYSACAVDAEGRAALQLGETRFFEKGRTGPRDLKEQVLELVRAATQQENDVRAGLSIGGAGHGGNDP